MKSMVFVTLILVLIFSAAVVANSNPIYLDFPTWQAEEPGVSDWWKGAIKDFESQHPNVEIRLGGVSPSGKHTDQVAIRLAANDPPDILHLPAARAREFARQGWLKPLDEFIQTTDIGDTWNPLQKYMQLEDGSTYGILLLAYKLQLYYNERILEEAGISVPSNPEEFLAAILATAKDTDNNGMIDQFGFTLGTTESYNFYLPVTAWVVGAGGHWAKNGVPTANTPEVVQALSWLKEGFEAGAIPIGLTVANARQLFYEGKAAMMIDGPWSYAGFAKVARPEIADSLKAESLPFSNHAGGASNSIHIPVGLSPEKENLSKEFIRLITSTKWQKEYATLAQLPAAKTTAFSETELENMPLISFFMEGMDKVTSFMPEGFEDRFSEFARIVTDELMKMATIKELSPEQTANSIQEGLIQTFGAN